jgi:RNA polymerase sigma-70 factor (ECF subfamily)
VSLDDHIRSNGELRAGGLMEPDRVFGQKQLAQRLQAALDALPFEQRSAIVLREVDGLSYEEIAYSMGVALGTVRSRLARARETLRAQLRDA